MAARPPSTALQYEPDIEEMITLDQAKELVETAERRGYVIRKPANIHNHRLIKQAVHEILAKRLTEARNHTKLNNDKINRLMLDQYLRRRLRGKAWSFTNMMSSRTIYLPDEEEVEILANILNTDTTSLKIHLAVIPWAMAEQKARRDAKKPRTRRDNNQQTQAKTIMPARIRKEEMVPKQQSPGAKAEIHETVENSQTDKIITQSPAKDSRINSNRQNLQNARDHKPTIPINAGDLKISHSEGHLQVHGKIWCTLDVAQKLRMIVPLKLLQQARNDDPWSYEINGRVHSYQLYNLMHVLYGAPRVTAVQMD